jgi:hypothetical protein
MTTFFEPSKFYAGYQHYVSWSLIVHILLVVATTRIPSSVVWKDIGPLTFDNLTEYIFSTVIFVFIHSLALISGIHSISNFLTCVAQLFKSNKSQSCFSKIKLLEGIKSKFKDSKIQRITSSLIFAVTATPALIIIVNLFLPFSQLVSPRTLYVMTLTATIIQVLIWLFALYSNSTLPEATMDRTDLFVSTFGILILIVFAFVPLDGSLSTTITEAKSYHTYIVYCTYHVIVIYAACQATALPPRHWSMKDHTN